MKIILIGFMGAGKTSVGDFLASDLNLRFEDCDNEVIKISGRSTIQEIFEKDGEICFRAFEGSALRLLMTMDAGLIASGGGFIEDSRLRKSVRDSEWKRIYLQTKFSTCLERIQGDTQRPLLKDLDSLNNRFLLRESLYREIADLVVQTDSFSIEKVANNIKDLL